MCSIDRSSTYFEAARSKQSTAKPKKNSTEKKTREDAARGGKKNIRNSKHRMRTNSGCV